MINNNHMTMRSLTMVNLVVAKGSRKQCTTSFNTIKCSPKKHDTHERRSKHKTNYIAVAIRDVRPAKLVF